jgi:hypothetical protein
MTPLFTVTTDECGLTVMIENTVDGREYRIVKEADLDRWMNSPSYRDRIIDSLRIELQDQIIDLSEDSIGPDLTP